MTSLFAPLPPTTLYLFTKYLEPIFWNRLLILMCTALVSMKYTPLAFINSMYSAKRS